MFFIQVFNSEDTTSSLSLGKFCGNRIPPPVRSEEGTIVVKFRSDDTVASKGFSAVYRYVQSSSENGVDGGGTGGRATGKVIGKKWKMYVYVCFGLDFLQKYKNL